MIVYIFFVIIIAILCFIVAIAAANLLFWFASYAISSFFALFTEKNQKVTQRLVQAILLFITTIFLFVYSHKSFTSVNAFGENSSRAIIGWFLLLTGLVSGVLALTAFGLSFDDSEKQKALAVERFAQPQEEKVSQF